MCEADGKWVEASCKKKKKRPGRKKANKWVNCKGARLQGQSRTLWRRKRMEDCKTKVRTQRVFTVLDLNHLFWFERRSAGRDLSDKDSQLKPSQLLNNATVTFRTKQRSSIRDVDPQSVRDRSRRRRRALTVKVTDWKNTPRLFRGTDGVSDSSRMQRSGRKD